MADDDLDGMLSDAVRDTDTEILNDAFQDNPSAETPPEPEAPVKEPDQKTDEQPDAKAASNRDPKTGQFTAKQPETPKEGEQAPDAKAKGAEQKPDDGGNIPSWRLKEEADARRAAEQQANALQAQLAQLNARLAALEPKQPKQETIDPLLDPEGFEKRIIESFQTARNEDRLNFNLALAEAKHGEKFTTAFEALLEQGQAGNRQLVNQLISSANPGQAIMNWHTNREALKEVGGDIQGYRSRIADELLKDPAFLTKAAEAARAFAAGSQGQPQNGKPVVELPPSLSRMAGSSKNGDPVDSDDSDAGIFSYAMK